MLVSQIAANHPQLPFVDFSDQMRLTHGIVRGAVVDCPGGQLIKTRLTTVTAISFRRRELSLRTDTGVITVDDFGPARQNALRVSLAPPESGGNAELYFGAVSDLRCHFDALSAVDRERRTGWWWIVGWNAEPRDDLLVVQSYLADLAAVTSVKSEARVRERYAGWIARLKEISLPFSAGRPRYSGIRAF